VRPAGRTVQTPRYARPEGCRGCSLDQVGFGFVLPAGPTRARLTFIGEAAGYEEALAGEPFVGAAGGTLSRLCHRAGIDRAQVRIHNVVSCRPPGDHLAGAGYEEHAIACCRQYLQPVLDAVPDNGVVVPLGVTALATVLHLRGVPGVAIRDFHGTVTRSPDDRYWVVPTFHPSHLQRGAMHLLEVVTQDLAKATAISQRGFTRSAVELVVDPDPGWFAAWIDAHLTAVDADPDGTHLALDTEFPEKIGGQDESEVTTWGGTSPLLRVNGANSKRLGWTVPYRPPYVGLVERLLAGLARRRGWVWLWNKYADWAHLQAAGHTLEGIEAIDAMWLWHYLQSDLPRGLGFVAPMASDFGAWKHWAKQKEREGEYAAADGVQTFRVAMWLLDAAQRMGMWEIFYRDWHERDRYVLRPAHDLGVPVNRQALETFHQELQAKLARVLAQIKATTAEGVLKPKGGYARKPKGPVVDGVEQPPAPPKTILGTPKQGGSEAKQSYMREEVQLVEREVEVEVHACRTCGFVDVGPKHRCKQPRKARRSRAAAHAPVVEAPVPRADLYLTSIRQTRWFWQLPFNPDARAQILAYLDRKGIDAPLDRKKRTPTTGKQALEGLKKQHGGGVGGDPFFELILDWRALQKVDATYAVGTLARLDADDRVHPEVAPKPATLRDSCSHPNLQNVIADKMGPESLAGGFRKVIEARDGVPPGVGEVELAAWEARWGGGGGRA
jgi:uracil-DNA glycosylase family 4